MVRKTLRPYIRVCVLCGDVSPLGTEIGPSLPSPSTHFSPSDRLNLGKRKERLVWCVCVCVICVELCRWSSTWQWTDAPDDAIHLIRCKITYKLSTTRNPQGHLSWWNVSPVRLTGHQSHRVQPASGVPGWDQSWQLNALQHSSQHRGRPHLQWQYWCCSERGRTRQREDVFWVQPYNAFKCVTRLPKYQTKIARKRTWWKWYSYSPSLLEGTSEPAFCMCSSYSESSYKQENDQWFSSHY